MKTLCLTLCWSFFALLGTLPLTVNGSELPERKDIPAQYKWDLSDMYPSVEAWEADKQRFLARLPDITAYRGRLAENGATLLDAIGTIEEISDGCGDEHDDQRGDPCCSRHPQEQRRKDGNPPGLESNVNHEGCYRYHEN